MALEDLLARLEQRGGDTPATPCHGSRGAADGASSQACTHETPETLPCWDSEMAPGTGTEKGMGAFRWWLVHYPDRPPEKIGCFPPATQDEVLAGKEEALAAVPFEPMPARFPLPSDMREDHLVRAWLDHIGETDPAIRAEVLAHCRSDARARRELLQWAGESLAPHTFADDRRTCAQCANLTWRGRCLAAQRGEIFASPHFEPVPDIAQRCAGYLPGPDDTDQRPGRERWPWLIVMTHQDGQDLSNDFVKKS